MRVRLVWLVALAAVASLPLQAQKLDVSRGDFSREGNAWVQEWNCSATAKAGGRLVVRLDVGRIDARPGAPDRITCQARARVYKVDEATARELLAGYELGFRTSGANSFLLKGEFADDPRRGWRGVELKIQVPLGFNLDLETSGGEIVVERLEGELRAATAGGEIRAGDVTGPVRAETAGGDIELGNTGQRLEARTAGGCIRVGDVKGDAILETSGGQIIAGRIEGSVRAETAGGDIVLRGAGTNVIAETAGGQIRIGESGGSVRAATSGGSILLNAAQGPVRVETAGGSINLYRIQGAIQATTAAGKIFAQIAAKPETFAASELQTAFGDIEVYLPPDLALTIDATIEMAAGHKILTDFPLQIEDGEPRYQPAVVRGHGPVNGGGQILRIHTVGGNIEIRKLTPALLESLRQKQQWLWEQWQEKEKMRFEKERLREQQRQKRREKEVKREEEPPSPF